MYITSWETDTYNSDLQERWQAMENEDETAAAYYRSEIKTSQAERPAKVKSNKARLKIY